MIDVVTDALELVRDPVVIGVRLVFLKPCFPSCGRDCYGLDNDKFGSLKISYSDEPLITTFLTECFDFLGPFRPGAAIIGSSSYVTDVLIFPRLPCSSLAFLPYLPPLILSIKSAAFSIYACYDLCFENYFRLAALELEFLLLSPTFELML